LTPSSKYDFKFKDYAPWVFRNLREEFHIDASDYLVRSRYLPNNGFQEDLSGVTVLFLILDSTLLRSPQPLWVGDQIEERGRDPKVPSALESG